MNKRARLDHASTHGDSRIRQGFLFRMLLPHQPVLVEASDYPRLSNEGWGVFCATAAHHRLNRNMNGSPSGDAVESGACNGPKAIIRYSDLADREKLYPLNVGTPFLSLSFFSSDNSHMKRLRVMLHIFFGGSSLFSGLSLSFNITLI